MNPSREDANENISFSVDEMTADADWETDYPYVDRSATLQTHSIGFLLRNIQLACAGGANFGTFAKRVWIDEINQEAIKLHRRQMNSGLLPSDTSYDIVDMMCGRSTRCKVDLRAL